MRIQMEGRAIEDLGEKETPEEGLDRDHQRRQLSVPKLPETLDPLCPQLQRWGDRLQRGPLWFGEKTNAVSIEEEAEVCRQPFRLPKGRRHHQQGSLQLPGDLRQHQGLGTTPEAGKTKGDPLEDVVNPLLETEDLKHAVRDHPSPSRILRSRRLVEAPSTYGRLKTLPP